MFENAVIETRANASGNRFITLPVSITVHTVFIGAALFAAVWSIDFPKVPPHLMELLRPVQSPPAMLAPPIISKGIQQPAVANPKADATTPRVTALPAEVTPSVPATFQPSSQVAERGESSGVALSGDGHPEGAGNGSPLGDINGRPDGTNVGGDPIPLDSNGPLQVGGLVKAPVAIERVSPVYPDLARRIRKEGNAVVECIIDRTGGIRDVRLISSDFPSFGDAALSSVRRWKFRPGTLNGNAVDTVFQLTIRFTLN
ncbi:MAG TPA: TonB family protein [Thermoanaerobaculia bacterium]|nr:TonB family protein [Thermoanaerobaculia bacterium]